MNRINEVSGAQGPYPADGTQRAQKTMNWLKGTELFPLKGKDLEQGVTIQRTSVVPERKVNPNDKRPDASDNFWNWMHGSFGNDVKNLKVRGNDARFTFVENTVDGLKNIECTVRRNGNTTVISTGGIGQDDVAFTEYIIDNKSGKIMQKTIYDGEKGCRLIYDEDGNGKQEWVEQMITFGI